MTENSIQSERRMQCFFNLRVLKLEVEAACGGSEIEVDWTFFPDTVAVDVRIVNHHDNYVTMVGGFEHQGIQFVFHILWPTLESVSRENEILLSWMENIFCAMLKETRFNAVFMRNITAIQITRLKGGFFGVLFKNRRIPDVFSIRSGLDRTLKHALQSVRAMNRYYDYTNGHTPGQPYT